MATIKAFSDLEQSKVLSEILSLESADMHSEAIDIDGSMVFIVVGGLGDKTKSNYGSPIWSLAALLDVMPDCPDLSKHTDNKWYITTYPNGVHTCLMAFNNPIDACYEMILKLHELNLL